MFYPNTTWLSQSPFWGCDNLTKCHLEMMHSQVPAERNAANERDAIGWILNEFVRDATNIARVMAI